MKKSNRGAATFAAYLAKEKMTTEQFSQASGVSYNTVLKWRYGRKPRRFVRETLRAKFPKCPLFA
jgi:DNA-binding transcriptional regulator YiaG